MIGFAKVIRLRVIRIFSQKAIHLANHRGMYSIFLKDTIFTISKY